MLERSGYVSYANCGLPYYVGGVITDQEELTLQTPESFRRRFAVDVRVRHEATAIDPTRKTVTVRVFSALLFFRHIFSFPYNCSTVAAVGRFLLFW